MNCPKYLNIYITNCSSSSSQYLRVMNLCQTETFPRKKQNNSVAAPPVGWSGRPAKFLISSRAGVFPGCTLSEGVDGLMWCKSVAVVLYRVTVPCLCPTPQCCILEERKRVVSYYLIPRVALLEKYVHKYK